MNEQGAMMKQPQHQPPLMNLNHNMVMNQMTQPQPQIVPMNRAYGSWPPPAHFQSTQSTAGVVQPPLTGFSKSLGPRSNWKGKKPGNFKDKRRNDQLKALMPGSISGGSVNAVEVGGLVSRGPVSGTVNMMEAGGSGNPNFTNYQPPALNELQQQNRLKTRKFFQKRKFSKNSFVNMNVGGGNNNNNNNYERSERSAPFAPRNTTSFIIRAKKSGGIASLVSPSPMTPAILPTPIFSPSREVVVDMAKEEWGVDGYGSMKGLIRLRSPGHEIETNDDEEEDEGGSSDSDVEEVTRRFDHDLSRFEMIYNPNGNNLSVLDHHYVLENRVDDQDSHIAQLEEENLILKERLFLMERELGDLRRRMQFLEQKDNRGDEMLNEEMMENESDNENESRAGNGFIDKNHLHPNASSSDHDRPETPKLEAAEKNEVAEADQKNMDHAAAEPDKTTGDSYEIEAEKQNKDARQ